jgi:hypothetical protein
MTATNKWYSYMRVTTIRIDVHPVGKIRHHTLSMLSLCMAIDHTYLVWSTYNNLSRSRWHNWTKSLLLRKRNFRLHPQHTDWPICGSPSCFSPLTTIEAVEKATQQATRLTRPIYQHAIGTFNTCSRGPAHQFLTDTGGGYNLEGANFHIPLSDLPDRRSPLST